MPVARSALASRAAWRAESRLGADQRRDLARERLDPLHPLVHGPELGVEGDALQLLQPVAPARPCGPRPRRSARRSGAPTAPGRCPRRWLRRRPSPRYWRRRRSAAPGPPARGSRTAKYLWWVRMEVRITSGGRSRKAGSMSPSSGTGHSARPATSSSRPSSSHQLEARLGRAWPRAAPGCAPCAPSRRAPRKLVGELSPVVVEVAHAKAAARAHEAMALGEVAALDPVDRRTGRPRRRTGRGCACSGRTQRSVPEPQVIDFGQGKARTIAVDHLGDDLGGRPARRGRSGRTRRRRARRAARGQSPVERRKPCDRRLGRADARALALLDPVGLGRRQAVHDQRQPARPGEGARAARRRARPPSAARAPCARDRARAWPACARGSPRRTVRAEAGASVSARGLSSSFTQASAHALHRSRMRPM